MADLNALVPIFEVWGVPGVIAALLWWNSRQSGHRHDPVAELLQRLEAMNRKQDVIDRKLDEATERLANLEGWREGKGK